MGGARTKRFGPHPSLRASHNVDRLKRALLSHLGENLPNGRWQRLRVVEQRFQLTQCAGTNEGAGDTRIVAHPCKCHVAGRTFQSRARARGSLNDAARGAGQVALHQMTKMWRSGAGVRGRRVAVLTRQGAASQCGCSDDADREVSAREKGTSTTEIGALAPSTPRVTASVSCQCVARDSPT